jgi:hypothetical protein
MIALTGNDEVNALAALNCESLFGRSNTYQLAPKRLASDDQRESVDESLRGSILGAPSLSFGEIQSKIQAGYRFKRTLLTENFLLADLRKQYHERVALLFSCLPGGSVRVLTADAQEPEAGEEVISLVGPDDDPSSGSRG